MTNLTLKFGNDYSRINSVLLPYLFWDAIAYICVVLILLLIPNSQVMWPWQNWLINKTPMN